MQNKTWTILFTQRFDRWLAEQDEHLQEKILASLGNLEVYGPRLSRPYVDTVKGSKFAKMKELRIRSHRQVIRAFFVFDPQRNAIILCAGNKSNDKLFYQLMLQIADNEYQSYLASIEVKK